MSVEKLETFELGIGERLTLQQLLNAQTGIRMEADVIVKFHADLGFTEDELEAIAKMGGAVSMTALPRSFTFGAWRLRKIREMLKAIEASEQVAPAHVSLLNKFIPFYSASTEDAELAEEYAALVAAKGTKDAAQAVEQAEAMVAVTPASAQE